MTYKERWEIENCFNYMKNSVVRKPLHAHDNETIEAQCFINHVALLYFYRLLRAMDRSGLNADYSTEEIIRRGNNIYKISEGIGHTQLTEMTVEDAQIFKHLGISLRRKRRGVYVVLFVANLSADILIWSEERDSFIVVLQDHTHLHRFRFFRKHCLYKL